MLKTINKDHLPFGTAMLWICPICNTINAYNNHDQERAERRLSEPVAICHGSCFDNVCGKCGADIVPTDSPILQFQHYEE